MYFKSFDGWHSSGKKFDKRSMTASFVRRDGSHATLNYQQLSRYAKKTPVGYDTIDQQLVHEAISQSPSFLRSFHGLKNFQPVLMSPLVIQFTKAAGNKNIYKPQNRKLEIQRHVQIRSVRH